MTQIKKLRLQLIKNLWTTAFMIFCGIILSPIIFLFSFTHSGFLFYSQIIDWFETQKLKREELEAKIKTLLNA